MIETSDIKLEELNDADFIIIDDFDLEQKQVLISDILSIYKLKNMSLEYYAFKLSGGLLSLIYNVNYYIPISSLISLLLTPLTKCKRQINRVKYNLNDHEITISNVYFRKFSPLRKHKHEHKNEHKHEHKQLIYGVNERNIKNAWKTYDQEFKDKPKIGDIIEVHYTVPYERKTPQYHLTHTPYVVSYIYPSNIHFPPYDLRTLRWHDREDTYKNGILFASCGDEDLTDEVTKLAGPRGNFYSDLPSRYGIRVTRNLLVNDNVKDQLVITDNDAEEYKFNAKSIIKC